MNLAAILTESAERHGDRPALKLDDTTVTYSMLDDGSARTVSPTSHRSTVRWSRVTFGVV
jgi:long-chain acyl-CoA synthetase